MNGNDVTALVMFILSFCGIMVAGITGKIMDLFN